MFHRLKTATPSRTSGRRPFIAEELPTDQATPNWIVDRRSLDYYRACPRPPRGSQAAPPGAGTVRQMMRNPFFRRSRGVALGAVLSACFIADYVSRAAA